MTEPTETLTDRLELTQGELDVVVGGVTKIGGGTLILSSSNTYAGATPVQHGIIAI